MPRLPSSTQLSISAGVRSNWRLAVATVVLLWMTSTTRADLRRAVQRLISSSIISLIGVSLGESNTRAGFQWVIAVIPYCVN